MTVVPSRMHLLAFGATFLVLSSLWVSGVPVASVLQEGSTVEFALEHAIPCTLQVNLSVRRGAGVVDISHSGEEIAYLSLPADWSRREVRGVKLQEIEPGEIEAGFVRWPLPHGATVSFAIPRYPESILFHNPSGITAQIKLTRVDLDVRTIERDSILVKDKSVSLW